MRKAVPGKRSASQDTREIVCHAEWNRVAGQSGTPYLLTNDREHCRQFGIPQPEWKPDCPGACHRSLPRSTLVRVQAKSGAGFWLSATCCVLSLDNCEAEGDTRVRLPRRAARERS